jgi:hypothetical protein
MYMKVVRVAREEFELSDGSIQPMMVNLGYIPTVEEFQKMLDASCKFVGIEVEGKDVDR